MEVLGQGEYAQKQLQLMLAMLLQDLSRLQNLQLIRKPDKAICG